MVFDANPIAVRREHALPHGEVLAFRDRHEISEIEALQVHLALEAHTRLLEKIGMPVQGKFSLLKEDRLEFDRRGIDIFRRENIPDIGGVEKYPAGLKGLGGTLVHIGQRAVTDSKNVDLQRVDRLKSVLPTFCPRVVSLSASSWLASD